MFALPWVPGGGLEPFRQASLEANCQKVKLA